MPRRPECEGKTQKAAHKILAVKIPCQRRLRLEERENTSLYTTRLKSRDIIVPSPVGGISTCALMGYDAHPSLLVRQTPPHSAVSNDH